MMRLPLPSMRRAASVCLWLVLANASAHAAETLVDPTLPPPSFGQVVSVTGTQANPVLQSILISPTRRSAIINGQAVSLQAQFMQWRLVKIDESEVTLRNGDQVQILKLFPDMNMRMSKSSSSATAGSTNHAWK